MACGSYFRFDKKMIRRLSTQTSQQAKVSESVLIIQPAKSWNTQTSTDIHNSFFVKILPDRRFAPFDHEKKYMED